MQSNFMGRLVLAGKIGIPVLLVFLVGFWCLGAWRAWDTNRTEQAIQRINNRHIDLEDVMGENLPPKPDQAENDATIAGIDVNNNAIRDDVELAIFEKYPNSAKIRAAQLQYAQALQLELTEVFNSETYIATLIKENRGSMCVALTTENTTADEEVDILVLNTNKRREKSSENTKRYLTGYGVDSDNVCEIDVSSLPN